MPAPTTPPTIEWVVETGAPIQVEKLIHRAAEISAASMSRMKGAVIGQGTLVDDAAGDGLDHIAAGDQRAGRLEHRSDGQRPAHSHRLGADRGADIVGDVVGADVQRHVGGDRGRRDDDHGARFVEDVDRGKNGHHRHEEQRQPGSDQAARHEACRLLDMAELGEVLVERCRHRGCPDNIFIMLDAGARRAARANRQSSGSSWQTVMTSPLPARASRPQRRMQR